MFDQEQGWNRAKRSGLILSGLCFLVALFAGPLASLSPNLDPEILRGPAIGGAFGAAGVALLFGLKPRKRPDPAQKLKIERRSLPLLLISTLSFVIWMPLLFWFTTAPDPLSVPVFIWIVLGLAFLLSLVTAPFLWIEMRAARADPSLLDERQQTNMARAYRWAFTGTFQIALLGGLAMTYVDVPLDAAHVAIGLAMISMLLWTLNYTWREWCDGRASG
ncbi:hypothetical protein [Tateyamaria sp. syn59]|uniref:hypothetical protein n=1 Tax=Tateyamaria sp. syn59 TaxID=2576942 RepID=UPI0011BFD076|nr:hypothetical protein [Tateyamaria sp. syn59]